MATTTKVKGKLRACYSASYMRWTQDQKRFYNLRASCSWFAWANDTAVHYAAIHCPREWTIGPAVCS